VPLELRVEGRRPPLHLPDDLGGEVVGRGTQPARGDDEVLPAGGEEAERGAQVVGPVPDDEDRADVDAEATQLLGQPRAVPVGHPPGEDLGAGDDDSCARAHPADPSEPADPPCRLPGRRHPEG
jgi:hypothetical protein